MYEAARIDDTIFHTHALLGFLAGAVLGCLLIAAVAAVTICTGGIGGFLLGLALGYLANVGAHGLLDMGEAIGSHYGDTTGKILRGSPDVLINDRRAAFVTAEVDCSKESKKQEIAQGSESVFINDFPASRKDDKTTCDAKIQTASDNVFIAGGTATYLEITPEIPDAYRKYTEWAFTAAAFVGGLAGVLRGAGRGALRCALKYAAGFVIGEVVGQYVINPIVSGVKEHVINPIVSGLTGHPVNVTTGRKLLRNEDETDFSLPGPLPISSSRFYSSGLTHEGMIGRGWLHEWDICLRFTENEILYTSRSGRVIPFPRIEPRQKVFLPTEQITLACAPDGRYLLYGQDEIYYVFGPDLCDDRMLLTRVEDQVGRSIVFQRDYRGLLERVTGSSGQSVRLHYGPANSVVAMDLVEGGTPRTLVRYGYDDYNRLTSVTDRAGRVVRRFSYLDQTTLMTSHTDALGFTCEYLWETVDRQPRVVEQRTSEGERYRFTYDTARRQTWVQDTFGNEAHWRYDRRTNVLENTWFDGHTTKFEYDENDNLTVMHLPGNRTVSLAYDDQSRLAALTDPLGRVTRNEYDGESMRMVSQTMPDGSQWSARYNHQGLLLTGKDEVEREIHFEYQGDGLPETIIDPRGSEQTLQWNKLGLITVYRDGSGKTSRYEYDADGNLVGVTDAEGKRTLIERNRDGAATQMIRPDGSREQFYYKTAGLMSGHRDPAGKLERREYNARGQLVRITSPAQRNVTYRYDQHGRMVELTNGNGSSTQFSYDAAGRVQLEIGFDQLEKHYRYDAAGFLAAVETRGQDDAGNIFKREMRFDRDVVGRLRTRHTETATTTYEYDDLNRLLGAQRRPTDAGKALGIVSDTVKFEYDAAGHLIAEEGANGRLTYTLDELGNLSTLTLPQGQQLHMLRTASGHVRQLRIGDEVISDIERDDLHREILRTQGRITTAFVFDAFGRRTRQVTNLTAAKGASLTATLERTYRYDLSGELIEQEDRRRGLQQFRYDDEGLLLSRTNQQGTEQFTWDDAGNLRPKEPPADSPYVAKVGNDRLKVWQDIRLTYDAFGNVATKKKGPGFEQRFQYDAEDRLMAVYSNSRRANTTTRFSYDAVGRRIGKTVRETTGDALAQEQETRFVWQGFRMVQEESAGNLRSYMYEAGSYTPMACFDQTIQDDGTIDAGKLYYFHTDQVGTPLEVTDSTGTLVWSGDYSAWGKLEHTDGFPGEKNTLFTQNLRYQGQYADESTGMHYNTFRYFDPEIGRFITQDPIGLNGGINLYQYAANPTRWTDPWGWAPGDYGEMPSIPGFQKHHIIPQNLENHPAIVESGYDVHNSRNLTYLPREGVTDPARTVHRGMHTADYDQMMRDNLNEIHNLDASPEIKKMHIEALQDQVGEELRTGKRKLNSAC